MHTPGCALFRRTPFLLAFMAAGWVGGASAQGIFSCVDAKGQRLTSDRPMLECIDREQRELNPNGTVRRVLSPSYTANERAAIEEKARREQEEVRRQSDERQRMRALALRYPNPAALERDRVATLERIEDLVATGQRRTAELDAERRKLEGEAAFYARTPNKMPLTLRRAIEDNARLLKEQENFLADQAREQQRIEQTFDGYGRQLQATWAQQGVKGN